MIENPEADQSRTLRLVWPQWRGAGRANIAGLLPDVPLDAARRGYMIGSQVLAATLPAHDGPTEVVPVAITDTEGSTDGVESLDAILQSLSAALEALARHDFDRVLTLGGECSVSVAPFAALAEKYGDELAVVWVDSHPDTDTPETSYDGYHAMAVSALLGHGNRRIVELLPAKVDPARVAIAGVHDWQEDAYANVGAWGLTTFAPDALRADSDALLTWLAGTGATKVAIHFDVDVVDSDEVALGLGKVPGGLSQAQVRRLVADISAAADVVGLTVAEFIPRDVLAIHWLIDGLPLIGHVVR